MLKCGDELVLAATGNSPHNQGLCAGPGIYHHCTRRGPIEDNEGVVFDPYYETECRNGRNFLGDWQVFTADNEPEDYRLCLKCAKRIAESDRPDYYWIDSLFDIPDAKHTIGGYPAFHPFLHTVNIPPTGWHVYKDDEFIHHSKLDK